MSELRQIFNVFLPKFLEEKVGAVPGGRQKSLQDCESLALSLLVSDTDTRLQM